MKKAVFEALLIALVTCACSMHKSETAENADVLYYPIDSIPADSSMIHVCTSEDGKIRFYCWDTEKGGTCPIYDVVCRFVASDGVVQTVYESDVAWVSRVNAITRTDGLTYYILDRNHKASSVEGYEWVEGLMIDGDTLRPVAVYDAGDDFDECGLEVSYNIPDWYFKTHGEGWDWLFEYDAETQNLYIPLTHGSDFFDMSVSDRYHVLHFNGMEFVDAGYQAHKGLHESLQDYMCLAYYFRTDDYIVRIDSLNEGGLRYASWKLPATMSDVPSLVIVGGTYDKQSKKYTFVNDGVEYIVGRCEDLLPAEDKVGEILLVKKAGEIVDKQKIKTKS